MMRASVCAAVVACATLVGTEGHATPIAYSFTGTVTGVGSSLAPDFSAGDSFSGIFLFDDQAAVIDSSSVESPFFDEDRNQYGTFLAQDVSYASPTQGVSGTLAGKYSFHSQTDLNIIHIAFPGGANDFWQLRSRPHTPIGSALNGFPLSYFGLFFGSFTENVIGSAALAPAIFDEWPINGFYLSFNPDIIDLGGHGETLVGTLTSFTPVSVFVPEPSSWALVGLGVISLIAVRRVNKQPRRRSACQSRCRNVDPI